MNAFYINANEGFFLRSAPTFYLGFPLKGFSVRFDYNGPNKFYRPAVICIRVISYTSLMLLNASLEFFGETRIVATIRTLEDIDRVWHKRQLSKSWLHPWTHPLNEEDLIIHALCWEVFFLLRWLPFLLGRSRDRSTANHGFPCTTHHWQAAHHVYRVRRSFPRP